MEADGLGELFGSRLFQQPRCAELPRLCYTADRFPLSDVAKRPPSDETEGDKELYEVRIIDNDHNTYGQVMDVTMTALGIDEEQAFAVAWEVDHRGWSVVARVPLKEANSIAGVIRTIGIEVQVNPIDKKGFAL